MALSTAQVLEHHLNAFAAADLAALLEDYGETSFMIAPDGTAIRGLAAIKALVQGFFEEFSDPSARFNMGLTTIEDDIAFITWSAETPQNIYEFGADTFVIRDGKIVAHTIGAKVTPKK